MPAVTEHDFSVVRSVGFVLAVVIAVGLQRSTYRENTSITEVETGLPGCTQPPGFVSAMISPLTQRPIRPDSPR